MTKRKVTRLDMHLHTPTSDGSGRPEDYVKAIQKAGLSGIVITDHHVSRSHGPGDHRSKRARPYADLVQKAVQAAGYLCFRGCEYSSGDGHILIYGVEVEKLDLGMYCPMQEVIWRTLEAGGVAIPSHPYTGVRKTLGDKVFKMKDLVALERYNGQNQVRAPYKDEKTAEAMKKLGLAGIGNSDAHQAGRVGLCFTEFEGRVRSMKQIVEILKSGEGYAPKKDEERLKEEDYTRYWRGKRGKGQTWTGGSVTSYSRANGVWTPEDPAPLSRQLGPSSGYAPAFPPGQGSFPFQGDLERAERAQAWEDTLNGIEDEDIPYHAYEGAEDPFFVSDDPQEIARLLNGVDGEKA